MRVAVVGIVMLAALSVAPPAQADLITYRFDGVVAEGGISSPEASFAFEPSEFTLYLTVNTNAPLDGTPDDPI
jgi:hypothetical protein